MTPKHHDCPKRNPILVTGSHRSGTTWMGQMLAAAPRTGYIHEPITPNLYLSRNKFSAAGGLVNPIKVWYPYLTDENSEEIYEFLKPIMEFRFPLAANLRASRRPRQWLSAFVQYSRFTRYRKFAHTPIVKDPIAFFAAPWLATTFGMNVLVTIRHPAAFYSSLKIKNWEFNFNNLAGQPSLLRETSAGHYAEEIRDYSRRHPPLIDQAILLWNIIHAVANDYRKTHPDWVFVRHEDLSADPVGGFKDIYLRFGLEFTVKAEQLIRASSGDDNPREQIPGSELVRNSKANISNWKHRLNDQEINQVRHGTAGVAELFYDDTDW